MARERGSGTRGPSATPETTLKGEALRKTIKKALVDRGLTQKELARRIGISEQALSHFLCGRRRLKAAELEEIADALGVPSAALTEAASEEVLTPVISTPGAGQVLLPPRRVRFVPTYPIGAGYNISFGDGDVPVGESLDEPVFTDVPDPHAFAGKVVGESMAPERPEEHGFREGDIVVFDTQIREWRNGAFCLVQLKNGTTTFKQVFDEGEYIRLHALRPGIPDERWPKSEVLRIYRAVRHIQKL